MKLPKVPMYSQHISQLCLRWKITACSENEARAARNSFMPNQAARSHSSDEWHPDETGILQPQRSRRRP